MDHSLTPTSLVRRSSHQVNCQIDEEIVLLNLKDGNYYNFDGTAANIWNKLENSTRIDSLVDSQCREYDVSEQQCQEETINFLETLLQVELIEIL